LNADIISVKRNPGSKVTIDYNLNDQLVKVKCTNIIVSFPQLLANLQFMDLNAEETSIFQNVRANSYFDFRVDVAGPIANNQGFNLASIDYITLIPPFPNILALRREIPYGPAVGYAYADQDITTSDMFNLVNQYLGYIPATALTQADLVAFNRHSYQAHFTLESLAQSPTPYTRLNNLQGLRNTYWTGALLSFAETSSIWQRTYTLIDTNFPSLVKK